MYEAHVVSNEPHGIIALGHRHPLLSPLSLPASGGNRSDQSQTPDLFKPGKEDGPTLHAVFYFTLKEEAATALRDLDSAAPSVRLLAEYFRLVPPPLCVADVFPGCL